MLGSFTLPCVYISKNFGICFVTVFKVSRLLATIIATILNPVTTLQKNTLYSTSSDPLEASISLTNPWTQPSRASFYFYQELFPLCSLIALHRRLLSKLCDIQNNNCENHGGEHVSFSSPQFSMQSKISRKNVFVPWGIS